VIAGDPNVQSVELVAEALGDLCDELVRWWAVAPPACVIEGRQTIVEEVGAGGTAVRTYLAQQFAGIIAGPDFMNVLPGIVAYDELHSERVAAVMNRISAIAGFSRP
jgi:hypothetical protein